MSDELYAICEEDLKLDEGCKLKAYPDPLSGGYPFTIGWGHAGLGIGPDTVWTQAQADLALKRRIMDLMDKLPRLYPWYYSLNTPRQAVLVEMAYQMGLDGLDRFHKALEAMEAHNWRVAHDEMLMSDWAKQTPKRAQRLAVQMLTGDHPNRDFIGKIELPKEK